MLAVIIHHENTVFSVKIVFSSPFVGPLRLVTCMYYRKKLFMGSLELISFIYLFANIFDKLSFSCHIMSYLNIH